MSLPAYFLAGRAIELALKSYMLLKGEDERSLRRVSHDLAKALDEAVRLGLLSVLPVKSESEEAVRWTNYRVQKLPPDSLPNRLLRFVAKSSPTRTQGVASRAIMPQRCLTNVAADGRDKVVGYCMFRVESPAAELGR
jgi:hypothetical protein